MSSPRQPRTPRRVNSSQETPHTPKTPRLGTTNDEVETPLRIGHTNGVGNTNSDSVSVPATSPGVMLPPTSPLHAGNICDIDLSSPLNYGTPRLVFFFFLNICNLFNLKKL